MSAAHVRRGGASRAKSRKAQSRVSVPKNISKRLPVDQARAGKLAGLMFGGFLLAIGIGALIAFDIPAKAERAAAMAIGQAGFTVSGYQIVGLSHMDRKLVDAVVNDELSRASEESGTADPPQTLVDVGAIRRRLLAVGWVKDARVSRRLPDTLVIDIVERIPAALWQNHGQLALIDSGGVVLDRVPIDKMPDLPLLIGPGANRQAEELHELMNAVPTLKPQLASASWIGGRRWDLGFQTGETISLPEGDAQSRSALTRFASLDRSSGLLGRGILRFDLRVPGKMVARLAREPGEPIVPPTPPAAPSQG